MILVFQSNKGSVLGNFKSYSCFPIQYYLDKKKKNFETKTVVTVLNLVVF